MQNQIKISRWIVSAMLLMSCLGTFSVTGACAASGQAASDAGQAAPGDIAPVASAANRLTEAQAVAIARAFCQKLGQRISAPATVITPEKNEDADTFYWQRCWKVEFSAQAKVDVADATGIVIHYFNEAYSISHSDNAPPGEPISQQEAVQLATTTLRATGFSEPLLPAQPHLNQYHEPPLAQTYSWDVDWPRQSQGVPYLEQHISVGMDAQTGEIRILLLMFPTPPLSATVAALSKNAALSMALDTIVNRGVKSSASYLESHLQIIQPDWNEKRVRLVWASSFVIDGLWQEVYVGAEKGEFLGGRGNSRPGGLGTLPKTLAPPPLSRILKTAQTIYLRPAEAKTNTAAAEKADRAAEPPLHFAAPKSLRKTTVFSKKAPTEDAPYEVVLVNKIHTMGVYFYFPKTGLLGRGSEWAEVPDTFKAEAQQKLSNLVKHIGEPRR